MQIQLEITQDDLWNFFLLYDQLGELQKQIWERIVWYCNRYPNAHPTQSKIAKGIPCSRKHVNRTFALFKKYGWIYLLPRGPRRAKTICIPDHLLIIDVSKRQYARRLEVTSKVTHSLSSPRIITSRTTGTIKYEKKRKPVVSLDVPIWLKNEPFSFEHKLKLSLCSHEAFSQANSETKDRLSCGWKIGNMENYLVETTIKIAQNRGEALNWRGYYFAKEQELEKCLRLKKNV